MSPVPNVPLSYPAALSRDQCGYEKRPPDISPLHSRAHSAIQLIQLIHLIQTSFRILIPRQLPPGHAFARALDLCLRRARPFAALRACPRAKRRGDRHSLHRSTIQRTQRIQLICPTVSTYSPGIAHFIVLGAPRSMGYLKCIGGEPSQVNSHLIPTCVHWYKSHMGRLAS